MCWNVGHIRVEMGRLSLLLHTWAVYIDISSLCSSKYRRKYQTRLCKYHQMGASLTKCLIGRSSCRAMQGSGYHYGEVSLVLRGGSI